MFLWVLFNFSFENGFEEKRWEAVKAWDLETSEVSPIYLQKRLKLRISVHLDFWLRKQRKKIVEFWLQHYCENIWVKS